MLDEWPFDGNTTVMTTNANTTKANMSSSNATNCGCSSECPSTLRLIHIGRWSVGRPVGRRGSAASILCLVAVEVHDEPTHDLVNMSYLRVVQLAKGEDLLGL